VSTTKHIVILFPHLVRPISKLA